jgi:hypothetical protein
VNFPQIPIVSFWNSLASEYGCSMSAREVAREVLPPAVVPGALVRLRAAMRRDDITERTTTDARLTGGNAAAP